MKGERFDSYIYSLGNAVQTSTNISDKILAVDSYDPIVLYCCNRKGWHSYPGEITPGFIQKYKSLGAKYLVGSKGVFYENGCQNVLQGLERTLPLVKETKDFVIFGLEH
jgi:hypothetical protein